MCLSLGRACSARMLYLALPSSGQPRPQSTQDTSFTCSARHIPSVVNKSNPISQFRARSRRPRCWPVSGIVRAISVSEAPRASLSPTGAMAQQPKPKRSSGGKGSAFTHAGTMSGPRATVADGAAGKDEPAAAATLVESRSSHHRLRDSESPCNNVAAPHKVRDISFAGCLFPHSQQQCWSAYLFVGHALSSPLCALSHAPDMLVSVSFMITLLVQN